MQNYKTAGEKAAEWNISSQHVQYLCRKEKIEGAIKRAGAWFIPDVTPNPVKYTKSGSSGFQFVGTKNKIFNAAIELFMQKGFNNVSLKDITDQVGIQQSTIYNHFQSKQEILDVIYDFYCHYYLENRPSLEELEPVLQDGSLIDIIGSTSYDFKEQYLQAMTNITKIIFQRIAIDERAREIGKSLILGEGIRYVEEVFNRGIEIERIPPIDTRPLAVLINSIRIFTLYHWIVDPSPASIAEFRKDERVIYEYAVKILTDLNHSATKGNAPEKAGTEPVGE